MPPSPSIFPTPCECTQPGWCARHKCHKGRVHFEYCRRIAAWFQRWERGEGPSSRPPAQAVQRGPCRHLGAEVRRQVCPTCRGRVELKVFACAMHHECALAANATGVRLCATCDDYEPAKVESAIPSGGTNSIRIGARPRLA